MLFVKNDFDLIRYPQALSLIKTNLFYRMLRILAKHSDYFLIYNAKTEQLLINYIFRSRQRKT